MSKVCYTVIDGTTRKIKKKYVVIDGVTREIAKKYVVVDGVTRLCYQNVIDLSAATVTLGAALTYNGSSQTKAVTVVLDGKTLVAGTDYTVTGNTGTNADSYTMTITGIGDYEGTITQEWSIAKATGSISVSPTTLSITGEAGTTKTATISYTGDGSISVSSSATGVATATRSGNTITVKLVATGSATITITMAEGTNYSGASCTIGVTTTVASTTLNDNDWATIAAVSAAGQASSLWNVGDTKTETLDGTSYTFRIVGFDHDDLNYADAKYSDSSYNGGKKKAGITFEMVEIFNTRYSMNSSSNSGGWNSTVMCKTVMGTMKDYMPTNLENALRKVSKLTSIGSTSSTIMTSVNQLFLLSEIEVIGYNRAYSYAGEGSQYAYYKAGNSCVKKLNNDADSWWLRSPYKDNTTEFVYIKPEGTVYYKKCNTSAGVSFAFCI